MPATTIAVADLPNRVGEEMGPGRWHQVTQEQIDKFADATGDHQWIHVDRERAKAGPFHTTIAHGYLTLSLIPMLIHEVLVVDGVKMGINYGVNKVRFPAPVPVDSNVRLRAKLQSVEPVDNGGYQVITQCTIEREGGEKPVCVAETVARYYG
jgi:acyl dehydratase